MMIMIKQLYLIWHLDATLALFSCCFAWFSLHFFLFWSL